MKGRGGEGAVKGREGIRRIPLTMPREKEPQTEGVERERARVRGSSSLSESGAKSGHSEEMEGQVRW